jgi:hypothetical protein
MEEESFSIFLNNLKNSLDNNKIDMLNGMSTETYTCAQAERILSTFNLGDLRVDALEILSTKLEDPENKGKIMVAFQNDSANTKTNAYKIINRIKVASNKPNPVPAKKAATRESYIPPDDDGDIVNKPNPASAKKAKPIEISGKLEIYGAPMVGSCLAPKTFMPHDRVVFSFITDRNIQEILLPKVEIWISECKNWNVLTCAKPYLKMEKEIIEDYLIYPFERKGPVTAHYTTIFDIDDFLSDYGKVKIPTKYRFYHIEVIYRGKLIARDIIKITDKLGECNGE